MPELVRLRIIAASFVVCFSHSEQDIDQTLDAIGEALVVYKRALEEGYEKYLLGRPVKPVFRRLG